MTMWWSETSAHWGWASCLLAVVMLLAFWAAVFAALTALLGTRTTHTRHAVQAPGPDRAARPADITISGKPATAGRPRCP